MKIVSTSFIILKLSKTVIKYIFFFYLSGWQIFQSVGEGLMKVTVIYNEVQFSRSVVSNSLKHYGQYPTRLLHPGFSRQEYWSELPCPPPGDLPDTGMEPRFLTSPVLAEGFFTTSPTWEAHIQIH